MKQCLVCDEEFRSRGASHRFCSKRCKGMASRRDIAARFWEKVDTSGDCWIWTGSKNPNGYGQLTIDNRCTTAHRVSWAIHNGGIPDGLHVLHHCDNPACIRPEHLFLGTHTDNMRDAAAKGRSASQVHRARWCKGPRTQKQIEGQVRGERNAAAKLTSSDVIAIRALAASKVTFANIAKQFGISSRYAQRIVAREFWRHIP